MSDTINVAQFIKELDKKMSYKSHFLDKENNQCLVAGLMIAKKLAIQLAEGETT